MASIKRRPNGKWRARYRDDDGKEHARHFDRKIDGQGWLDTVTASIVRGDYVDPKAGKVTFRSFFDSWAADQVWTSGTEDHMNHSVSGATFADMELAKIRKSHIEKWVKSMIDRDFAPLTIRNRLVACRTVFRAAVADRIITLDPTTGVRTPRLRQQSFAMRIPTPEDVAQLVKSADPFFRVAVVLGAFAGLRQGEICGLQLSDFDFLRRELHVQRQVQRRSPRPVEIRAPKYGSERIVHLPSEVLDMVAWHVKEIGVYGDDEWLLLGRDGGPMWPRAFDYRFGVTAKAAGVDVQSHDLRHYFASGLIAQGCDVVTVQRALGHKSASVTLNTYSHLWPTADERTRTAVSSMFADSVANPADYLRTADGE
ncbi:tyrosine-type recombinase/integrase [Brevibacterium litoralis]|uniref:tyrosine-type recombinase/integrase n=1 Tax=Brevibacterium litoralis TaxID=3138935 RepID=UPI0032EC056C